MSSLYVAGQHLSRKRRVGKVIATILIVAIVIGSLGFTIKTFLDGDTTISSTPAPSTSKITASESTKQQISTQLFAFDLPADWQPTTSPSQPYRLHSWQNTAGNKGVRVLTVYVDGAPQTAVNRSLPVQANGARLVMLGGVSDNCVNFTQAAKETSSDSLPGKWHGVDFLCDTANYARNVVGTSSPDGVNTVRLSSATNGQHTFFFAYTDNSATPDYNIFTDAINSFRLK